MKIPRTFPTLGPLLFRHTAGRTAAAVRQGNLSAVTDLAAIARTGSDAPAQAIALSALNALPSQDAIGLFCNDVMLHEDQILEELAVHRGYMPAEPAARALFLYATGQEEALCRYDPDPAHPLLAQGYAAAPDRIKTRVLGKSSGTRMGRILAHVLIGKDLEQAAIGWSYGEWDAVISGLAGEGAWDLLWQLVPFATPLHAVAVLSGMKVAGWRPHGGDRQVFEDLIRMIPEAWAFPAPEKPLISIKNQDSLCLKLAFSPDGTFLASGNGNGRVEVWQVSSGRIISSCTLPAGPIDFLAIVPGNGYVVAGSGNCTLTCLDISSGNTIWTYADRNRHLCCKAVSGNGEELLAGDDRGRMIRLACRTGKVLLDAFGHPARVTAIAPAPDGKRIAFGHADGTICCRASSDGSEMWAAPGTGDGVRGLAFSEQSDLILAVYEHSFPAQREASTGILVRTGDGHFVSPVCLAVLAEKQLVLAGGEDHILRLWHGQERYPAEIPFYNRLPTCCALTPDGTCAVVGCNEGTIYFISIPDGRRMREFRGYRQAVTACALSPDGRLLASTGGEGAVTLRAVPSGRLTRTLRRPAGAFTALFPLSGPGGAGLVAGTAGGTACIFSSKEGMLVRSLDMYTPSVRALTVSPDGTCLACAGSDASLRIWDLEKGGLAATYETPSTTAKCLAFLPDSAGFVSGGWDGVVRIWGTSGGKPSAVLAGHSSTITCCCVDPTGRLFATGSNDSTLRLWLLPEGTAGPVLCEADKEVSACAISPGGNFLAAAGTDPVIRLYHLPEGIFAGTIPQIPGKPTVLVFSEDGESLIAGYDHGLIAFYSVHGRTLLRTRSAHTGAVTGLVPLKGEDCIATSGADGMIHIFRIPFMRPLSRTTLADLVLARELEQQDAQGSQKEQWKFLLALLSLRFQNEIELCPLYQDAGIYDIQIVG